MNDTIPSQDKILLRVRQGKKEHPEYGPYLDFWERILLVQASFLPRIKIEEKSLPLSSIRSKAERRFSALSLEHHAG